MMLEDQWPSWPEFICGVMFGVVLGMVFCVALLTQRR